jgi:hypothetical protein
MNTAVSSISTRFNKTVIAGLAVAALSLGVLGGHAHAQDNVIISDNTPCHANGVEYPAGSIITRGGRQFVCLDGAWEETFPAVTGTFQNSIDPTTPSGPIGPVKTNTLSHAGKTGLAAD